MGQICCPKSQQINAIEVETEKEIKIQSYSSKADKDFAKLEDTYNLLKEISFQDYLLTLTKFSMENATVPEEYGNYPKSYSHKETYYTDELPTDIFQSFIENKILRHPKIYTKAGENETLASIFKNNLIHVHKGLSSKLEAHNKTKFSKSHAMALGLLSCYGSNISKIRFIFDLFEENGRLVLSEEFKSFLLGLFIIPSYAQLFSRNKLSSCEQIGEYTKERMKEILDCCEMKDCLNLVQEVACKDIFGNETSINYEQFKEAFARKEKEMGWMLSPKGIRAKIEANNV